LEKNTEPTSEALLDASHLAAFYSDRRAETQVEVLYTRAKYVRKSKGAAPGSVGVSKEKTINLRIENDRLDRLLGRELPE
jgi:predicted ribosome quality control (RQC) complex YloA/Tae2 family protein